MYRSTLLATSLIVASSAAFAGNISEPIAAAPVLAPVAVAPASDWSGLYVGGQFTTGEVTLEGETGSLDVDGFGLHAGYLYDMGSFVLGGELDYDMLEIEGDGGSIDVDATRLKAIAGYDLGSFMPYVTAGAVVLSADELDSEDGTFVGLGGMYQINDSFRVGGEYLMHSFDDEDADVNVDTFSLRASYSF